jgi:hypothetical protein
VQGVGWDGKGLLPTPGVELRLPLRLCQGRVWVSNLVVDSVNAGMLYSILQLGCTAITVWHVSAAPCARNVPLQVSSVQAAGCVIASQVAGHASRC